MIDLTETVRSEIGKVIRAAYELDPRHRESRRRLAGYLFNIDALEELVQRLGPSQHTETDAKVLHFVGLAALLLGDGALAELTLSRAVANGHSESLGHWVKALHALNKTTEAYTVGMRTLRDFPDDDPASQTIFTMLLVEQRYAELWDLYFAIARCWRMDCADGIRDGVGCTNAGSNRLGSPDYGPGYLAGADNAVFERRVQCYTCSFIE